MKTQSSARKSGFTLMELMVAMAITTIIVTILVSVTSIALDTFNRSRSETRAARQAKAMADIVARDLEGMVTRRGNTFQWLYAESSTDNIGPSDLTSPGNTQLVFFTAATDRYNGNITAGAGDVSAVAYRLQYQDPMNVTPTAGAETFVFYRKLVNPDAAFASLLAQPDLKTAFAPQVGSVVDSNNFVCENIYQFTVTFQVEVTTGTGATATKRIVPVTIGRGTGSGAAMAASVNEFRISGNSLIVPAAYNLDGVNSAQIAAGRLISAEISLTVLTDNGVQQMNRRAFADSAAQGDFMMKNSYQYTKLVELPSM